MSEKKKPEPAGKSLSARAKTHDWSAIVDAIKAAALAHPTIDFDEEYVHAIQKALRGRDNAPLLKLLDEHRLIHPALLPALADVIRSQRDAARGRPPVLTEVQSRNVRLVFDQLSACHPYDKQVVGLRKLLAKMFDINVVAINRSLKVTAADAK